MCDWGGGREISGPFEILAFLNCGLLAFFNPIGNTTYRSCWPWFEELGPGLRDMGPGLSECWPWLEGILTLVKEGMVPKASTATVQKKDLTRSTIQQTFYQCGQGQPLGPSAS